MKVGIVGCGFVGSTAAYAMSIMGVASGSKRARNIDTQYALFSGL